jgi:hypothetical protein
MVLFACQLSDTVAGPNKDLETYLVSLVQCQS